MSTTTTAKKRTGKPKIRRRSVTHPTNPKKSYQYHVVDLGLVDGKRKFRNFKTKSEAEAFVACHQLIERKVGNVARELTKSQLRDAVDAFGISKGSFTLREAAQRAQELPQERHEDSVAALKVLGDTTTLENAARYYIDHRDPPGGLQTINHVIQEYVGQDRNLRERSIEDMCGRLGKFSETFGERPICDVSRTDVAQWLKSLRTKTGRELSPRTRQRYKVLVSALFNYGIENDYVTENPFASKTLRGSGKTMYDTVMPGVLSVDEVERLLHTAQTDVPSMVPALAIGCFCGLRTAEIRQLDYSDISLSERLITVSPRIAKKRRVRHVDIPHNLLALISPYHNRTGKVAPQNREWALMFNKVRKMAGIENWPHNAMRHSFASYHLAMHGDPNKTALLLGHRDTKVLFDHYRGLVTKQSAEKFWRISPASEGQVIRLGATA